MVRLKSYFSEFFHSFRNKIKCCEAFMDDKTKKNLIMKITQIAVPVFAFIFLVIYISCGIYFVSFDPKYKF